MVQENLLFQEISFHYIYPLVVNRLQFHNHLMIVALDVAIPMEKIIKTAFHHAQVSMKFYDEKFLNPLTVRHSEVIVTVPF